MSEVKKVKLYFTRDVPTKAKTYVAGQYHEVELLNEGSIGRWFRRGCLLPEDVPERIKKALSEEPAPVVEKPSEPEQEEESSEEEKPVEPEEESAPEAPKRNSRRKPKNSNR